MLSGIMLTNKNTDSQIESRFFYRLRSQLGKVFALTLETIPIQAYSVMTEEPP